jgi:hypothetical protein
MIRLGGTGTRAYCGGRCRRVRRNRFRRLVETGSEEPLGRFERDVREAFEHFGRPGGILDRARGLGPDGVAIVGGNPNERASRAARETSLKFVRCLRFDRRKRAAGGCCVGCGVALPT